jgi:hypothetical protein
MIEKADLNYYFAGKIGPLKKNWSVGSLKIAEGDARPAHLPRLGSLLCTWIRAGHLGSRAGQPGSGARLSQLGERVGLWR